MKKIGKVTLTGIGIIVYMYLLVQFSMWVYQLGFTGNAKTLVLFSLGFIVGYSMIAVFLLVGFWVYNEYNRYKTLKYLREREERRKRLNSKLKRGILNG